MHDKRKFQYLPIPIIVLLTLACGSVQVGVVTLTSELGKPELLPAAL